MAEIETDEDTQEESMVCRDQYAITVTEAAIIVTDRQSIDVSDKVKEDSKKTSISMDAADSNEDDRDDDDEVECILFEEDVSLSPLSKPPFRLTR